MSEIDPQLALTRMWKNGPLLAQAKAQRVWIEEYRKSMKAILMSQSTGKSMAEQERDAYSHKNYIALLHGLKVAVEEEETLRWGMVKDQAAIEVWRSSEASNRAMDRGTK